MKPEYWQLYKISGEKNRLEWDELAGRKRAKYVCPANPAHKSSGRRLGDLHLLAPDDPSFDIYWTWDTECVVQESVLRSLRAQGFTGFEVRPVHLRREGTSDQPLPILWEIVVTGWGGMAPPESGIERIERCSACGRQLYTGFTNPELLVDERQWDGSDFFMVWPMPRAIFITDRVASLIRDQGLTGALLLRLDQLPPARGFGPLPLRLRMPEERAHRLGDPLDIY